MDLYVLISLISLLLVIAGQFVILKTDRVADRGRIKALEDIVAEVKINEREREKTLTELRIAFEGIKNKRIAIYKSQKNED